MIAERASDLIRFGSYLNYNNDYKEDLSGHHKPRQTEVEYHNDNDRYNYFDLQQQSEASELSSVWSNVHENETETTSRDLQIVASDGQQELDSILLRSPEFHMSTGKALEELVNDNNNEQMIMTTKMMMMMMSKNGLT